MIRNLITSSLLRVPCASTEEPRTHQTLQGQVPGHLGGGIETLFSRGEPHGVPLLSSGPGPEAQGGCKPLHGRLRGPWLPSPVTDLDGYQGGPEGAPERPAPMQLPYRDSRFHSRLPASCHPSSPATLPLPGGRNLVSLFAAASPWMRGPS